MWILRASLLYNKVPFVIFSECLQNQKKRIAESHHRDVSSQAIWQSSNSNI